MAQHQNRGEIRVLNVAEKPSVARSLASVFSRMRGVRDGGMRRDVHQIFTHHGVSFPNAVLQDNNNNNSGQQQRGGRRGGTTAAPPAALHTMLTTSVRGHLATQDFGQEYGWSKVDPVVLFEAPIRTFYSQDMESLRRMLENLAKTVQAVILWLDCDREGEAIGDEVRTVCLDANRNIRVLRARFSTVLAPEIQRALQSLGPVNENFVQAVQSRMELDLRVGAAFTRFQTLRLQRKFDGFSEGVISYGPCQFPTLGFVVERWARIQIFVPEDFWYIDLSIQVGNNNAAAVADLGHGNTNPTTTRPARPIQFQWKRGRIYDRIMTTYFYEACLDFGDAVVTHLHGQDKSKWKPVPLATVELQKRASRFLRLGSQQLMTAAEELYNGGYISYPRTETEKFSPEFQHRPLLQQFANLQAGGELTDYANKLLNGLFQHPRNGPHDDQAHPPITPCKAVDPNSISDATQRGVYTLVAKHYLACCSRNATGRETQLTVRLDSEEFTAKGLMILEKNWLEIYAPWERWSTGQGELPPLQIGSRIRPSSLLLKEGRTTPPQHITEVELITMMDRNGIGTDATIAQHIATIQDREYAIKDANLRFQPTQLGIALVEAYNTMGHQLNKPDLRRETEAECNLVAAGRRTKQDIMATLLTKMKTCYEAVTQEADKLDTAVARHFSPLGSNQQNMQVVQASFSECGSCGSQMALKQERNGRGNNNNGARRKLVYCHACQSGWMLPRGNCRPKTQGDDISNNGLAVKCPICNFQVIQILRGEGYEGNGYHVCPKCFSDPPTEHGGIPNGGEFRCFTCRHPTCTLAAGLTGGDAIEVFDCPFCRQTSGGMVCLRKNSRGFVLSCNKYSNDRCPYTIWLPKACQTITVPDNDENNSNGNNHICRHCSTEGRLVKQIRMVFRPGSVPPHIGRECTACILCDADLRRDLEVNLPNRSAVMTRPTMQSRRPNGNRGGSTGGGRRPGGRTGRGTGRGRGGGGGGRGHNNYNSNNYNNGGNACYKCGQPGHFANSCPNNR